MPTILAIETASERCSIALQHQGQIIARDSEIPRGHASFILPMVQELLEETELTLASIGVLAYSKGPGAFTSIRIGTSVVQGLALGADIPVVGASSLEIMAHHLHNHEGAIILPALDARMNEVYFGVYQIINGVAVALQGDQVAKPDKIRLEESFDDSKIIAIGSGWQVYQDAMRSRFDDITMIVEPEKYPHARDLLLIAQRMISNKQLLTAEQILPVYVRDKVTHGS